MQSFCGESLFSGNCWHKKQWTYLFSLNKQAESVSSRGACMPVLHVNLTQDEVAEGLLPVQEVLSDWAFLHIYQHLSAEWFRTVRQLLQPLQVPAFLTTKLKLNHNVICGSSGAWVTATARSVPSKPLGSGESKPYNNPVSRGGRAHQHVVAHL